MSDELEDVQRELLDCKSKRASDNQHLIGKIDALTQELNELKRSSTEAKYQMSQYRSINEKMDMLESNLTSNTKEVSETKALSNCLKVKINAIDSSLTMVNKELTDLKQKSDSDLQSMNNRLDLKTRDVSTHLDESRGKTKQLQTQASNLKEKIDWLETMTAKVSEISSFHQN